ncbi:MAG: DUF362 domain-containing protein [Candidatus Omnitrophica bacterium]|nr:DUF362 domain-containing protein [Candidatus Omnitrophota bacterium]MDD5236998.1 DUF362 domain-containing protein [Candidatus Omnitrophota bacterium]MDD5609979.1 DUF362 domain-containing protein [Candidatus Omnitrophota bacterium]
MSKVYFIAAKDKNNIKDNSRKLLYLVEQSKLLDLIKKEDLVALKLHFGEDKNTGYVNPEYLGLLVGEVRKRGAKPFLTDTNTLYKGRRANAVDHLEIALEHGFVPDKARAPIFIADGFMGEDYEEVEISQKFFKTAFVAKGIRSADSMVVVSHFKGHIMTGFGGALKNLGMGCAARVGKLKQHADVSPFVVIEKCIACEKCVVSCPVSAIKMAGGKASIDNKKCIGCANCIAVCPVAAIEVNYAHGADTIQQKMIEYASAALKGKEKRCVFINFAMKITKECDCLAKDDPLICEDIGIFTSSDPVSLDKACVDIINKVNGKDIFRQAHPERDWSIQLAHAAKLGIGSLDYELIEYKI